jgi:hypothetical protein
VALIHQATLTPTKDELLAAWLPRQSWAGPGADRPQRLGAYRFDDPAGDVGTETFFLGAGDAVLHVPVTYRGTPLEGGDEYLIGVSEHSVLGRRWVYDGCGDPVYVSALVTAMLTGATQVEEVVQEGRHLVPRAGTAGVRGSGDPTTLPATVDAVTTEQDGPVTLIRAGAIELVVVRVVGGVEVTGDETLVGGWGDSAPSVLAALRVA